MKRSLELSARSVFYLLLLATVPTAVEIAPSLILPAAGKDALAAILLGAVLVSPGVLLVGLLLWKSDDRRAYLPDQLRVGRSPWARALYAAGVLALAVGLPIIWGELLVPVKELLLTDTPYLVIFLPTFLVVWYLASGGLAGLAKVANLLGLLVLLGSVLFAVLIARFLRWSYLLPLWPELHSPGLWSSAWVAAAYLGEGPVLALPLGAYTQERKGTALALVWAVAVNTVILVLATGVPLALFGPWYAARRAFPFVDATRSVHYGFVVERIDILHQLLWAAVVLAKLALWGWVSALFAARALGWSEPTWWLHGAFLAAAGLVAVGVYTSSAAVLAAVADTWAGLVSPFFFAVTAVAAVGLFVVGRRRAHA